MMKIAIFSVLAIALALTACGKKDEHVHAVDYVDTAATQARENAPKAEEIKFDDHGQPVFPGTITTAAAEAPAQTDSTAATADATAQAATETAAEATAEATAEAAAEPATEATTETATDTTAQ